MLFVEYLVCSYKYGPEMTAERAGAGRSLESHPYGFIEFVVSYYIVGIGTVKLPIVFEWDWERRRVARCF